LSASTQSRPHTAPARCNARGLPISIARPATTCGVGDTEDCRFTTSVKYRVDIGWQFAKKFDAYAGIMFSQVNGGLANGYLDRNTIDPTAGLRFRF
jgi:hypothetical protein